MFFLEYYFANRKLISISIFKTVQLHYTIFILWQISKDYPHYTIHAPKLQYENDYINLLILLFKPLTSSFWPFSNHSHFSIDSTFISTDAIAQFVIKMQFIIFNFDFKTFVGKSIRYSFVVRHTLYMRGDSPMALLAITFLTTSIVPFFIIRISPSQDFIQ
jgi:hypothetical protein